MRFRATILAGNYTSTPAWIEIPNGLSSGDYKFTRIRLWINGNAATGELGVYQMDEDEDAPTDAELAAYEEFYDDNVVQRTAPVPELNIVPDAPHYVYLDENKSLYVRWLAGAGDTATSGTVDLFFEKEGN